MQPAAERHDGTRVVFRVRKLLLDPARECLALIGSPADLGAWNPELAIRADYTGMVDWLVDIRLEGDCLVEYKWAVVSRATGAVTCWEGKDNRRFQVGHRPLLIADTFDGEGYVTEL